MVHPPTSSIRRFAAILLAGMLLTGCASTRGPDSGPGDERQATPGDPLESINRPIHNFNQAFDRHVAAPVARGYQAITPEPVDHGVSNFFSNLDDVSVLVNSVLQLKGRKAAATTLRLTLNTTFGLFGLFDVAGGLGIPKEDEDFGQTLGHWGVGSGPYVVLPVLGPSSLRDAPGRAVDASYWPLNDLTAGTEEYYAALLLYGIDTRAGLLGTTDVLDTAALDSYSYTRDAWLRRRANQVFDGTPPPEALPDAGSEGDDGFDPFSDEGDENLFDEPADGADGGSPAQ